MQFTQVIDVEAGDANAVAQQLAAWHAEQHGVAPGYQGYRLLLDRDEPRHCVILVDFTSFEEAQANNERPETQAWAAKLRELAGSEPRFLNCDAVATS
jgi:quinol monooxygenase YgiN